MPDNLSLIPGTRTVEGESQLPQEVHVCVCVCVLVRVQVNKCSISFSSRKPVHVLVSCFCKKTRLGNIPRGSCRGCRACRRKRELSLR